MARKKSLASRYKKFMREVERDGQRAAARKQRQRDAKRREAAAKMRQMAREKEAAERQATQAQRVADRADAAAMRKAEQARKQAERERQLAYQADRQDEVDALNDELALRQEALASILTDTLDVDDHIDLEELRSEAEHPPFPDRHLEEPTPLPDAIPEPPRPERPVPEEPKGLFGRRRKREEAELQADEEHAEALQQWEEEMATLPELRAEQQREYAQTEARRQNALAQARERYQQECAEREKEAAQANAELDELIVGLGYGTPGAVCDYVSLVLDNSEYPEGFSIEHQAEFEPTDAELRLVLRLPAPDTFEEVKAYRYVKSSDEIAQTAMTQKDKKDRYAGILHAVALRTLHEVFEADRRGLVRTISLEAGTESINPATGRMEYSPLLAVATSRETFLEIDLSAVVPTATLEHLGATVSKNPYAVTAIDVSGIRRA
ncbi:MAG: hypothetical protein Q4G34_05595 [Micrococcus sp.]|nr:hypothetical protein [Micrococcus sp.]